MLSRLREWVYRNTEWASFIMVGVVCGVCAAIKFDEPWQLRLLIFFLCVFIFTVLGVIIVSMLNYVFDWAHDRERARDLLDAAQDGDADAAYEIARNYYRYDRFLDKDAFSPKSRIEWCRKAVSLGNVKALTVLGTCYAYGEDVPKDAVEAVKWYRKAAEQGDACAQWRLGQRYRDGEGVPKDAAEAVKWYRKAAEQGDASAQNSLGQCYRDGEGVPKDAAEAVKWYRKAAEQGYVFARLALLDMLERE